MTNRECYRGSLSDLPTVWVTRVMKKSSFDGSGSKCLQSLAAFNSFSVYKRLERRRRMGNRGIVRDLRGISRRSKPWERIYDLFSSVIPFGGFVSVPNLVRVNI